MDVDTANRIILIAVAVGAFVGAIVGYKVAMKETTGSIFSIISLAFGGAFCGGLLFFGAAATTLTAPIIACAIAAAGIVIYLLERHRKAKIFSERIDLEHSYHELGIPYSERY